MTGEYEFHDAANELPLLDGKRFSELVKDIETNGLHQPIILCEEKILDGRNRYRACKAAGVEPKFTTFIGGDPYGYVWSLNGERRDLTADQRYLVWKSLHEKSEGWQAKQQQIREDANRRRSEAAKEQPRDESGRMTEKPVAAQVVLRPASRNKDRQAKAEASKTNRGSVERMDRLTSHRPDLAAKVKTGELRGAEAMRLMKRDEVSVRVSELPKDKYRIIYADPPWKYGDSRQGLDTATGAEHHYPTMTLTELCSLPVADMAADDSVLFMWATSPLLEEAFKVISAWGFKYKSSYIWNKVKHNLGHYNSVRHELLLIATRGSCLPDSRKLHNSVVEYPRTGHSEKPEAFREIIDAMYTEGQRIELFRRGSTPEGWHVWGNEADAA